MVVTFATIALLLAGFIVPTAAAAVPTISVADGDVWHVSRDGRRGPHIAIREPRQGAIYSQGQAVEARYSCSGAVSCIGPVADGDPLPTDRAGPAAFVVWATDAPATSPLRRSST